MIGVYQIWLGDYYYIGSSGDCEARCKQHLRALQNGDACNRKMQAVFNKYQQFDYQIVIECDSRDAAYSYEQDFIDTHFGLQKCLNLSNKATSPGTFRTTEHKQNISKSLKGLERSPQHCENISKSKKGKQAPNKGVPASDMQKKKQSGKMKALPKLQCPHCGKFAASPNFRRWHGNNCRNV